MGVSSDGYSFHTYQHSLYWASWDGSTWSTKARLDDNGRLGIGDTSPGSPLDVKSAEAANTANFNSTNGATNITFESNGSLIGQMEFIGAGPSQIVTRTTASLGLGSNNVKTLYITDDDRVGIGTDSPSEKLHVDDGDILVSSGRGVRANGGNEMIRFNSSNGVQINSGGAERLRVKTSGEIQLSGSATIEGSTTLRDGMKFLATEGAAPTGDDHLDVPIKFAAYTEAVDSTDVSNGSVDLDLDIYRDNYLSLNALLFDANTNVVHAGLPSDESWLKEIVVFAAGGVRVYFGSSVASGDTVKLLVAYTGNTG
jgi:hypothetical protein